MEIKDCLSKKLKTHEAIIDRSSFSSVLISCISQNYEIFKKNLSLSLLVKGP